jgi:hypothetical protein
MRKYIVTKLTAEHTTLLLSSLRLTAAAMYSGVLQKAPFISSYFHSDLMLNSQRGLKKRGTRSGPNIRAYLADLKPLSFQRCPRIHCMIISLPLRLVFLFLGSLRRFVMLSLLCLICAV